MSFEERKVRQFKILEKIGSGGMGDVFLAFDETLERKVALKSIKREIIDEESKARFLREARILSQLDHPNICTVYDFIEEEKESFLVIEYV
ncbi:MAG: protein kinase, partial [Acidobacteria bacterium]|nr:protein kinase [Acidobacteriota bacterium]